MRRLASSPHAPPHPPTRRLPRPALPPARPPRYPYDTWFRGVFPEDTPPSNGAGWFGDHEGISAARYHEFKGHFFGLFREPARRAVSAYSYMLRSYPNHTASPIGLREYALRTEGYVAKMLAGQIENGGYAAERGVHEGCWGNLVPGRNTCNAVAGWTSDAALHRLNTGFRFVGLTDRWHETMCLFHAKFGGQCMASELQITRPTDTAHTTQAGAPSSEERALALRRSFVDSYDTPLYEAAVRRFEAELRHHSITAAGCHEKLLRNRCIPA